MLFRCFGGCVWEALSFLSVPAAAFDIEDHLSTGLRSKSCSGTNRLFFSGSGRNVWHWRSPQHRSKNGVLELARPCCFPVPEAAFLGRLLGQKSWFCRSWYPNATEGANGVFRRQLEVKLRPTAAKTFFFFRFWTRRLTLKITPTQVETRCHWARQAMLFPCSGGSLFGKAFGSEVVVLPVVIPKRNRRCQRCISKAIGGANCAPKLQKPPFFLGSGRDVWQWRSPQSRSKNGRGFATMDAKRGFTWQVQKIGWFWRVETWFYVAGARNRTLCENRGRRSSLWTLPKRWQACVIWRIAFYVTGAGNPHHGCYV